jgi:hypothetical protein
MELVIERTTAARPRCVGSSKLFFSDRDPDIRRALAMCGDCPVRRPCGEGAVAREERYGIWGGMSESEVRRAIQLRAVGRTA